MSDTRTMPSSVNAGKTTILVVDDEVLVRAFLSDTLRDQGYTVVEAINADEALAIIRSSVKLDLVLTDMRMPGLIDGAGLVRLLRAEFPFLKVVMIAAQVPDMEVRELLDGFLLKPIRPTQLSSFVRTILPARDDGGSP